MKYFCFLQSSVQRFFLSAHIHNFVFLSSFSFDRGENKRAYRGRDFTTMNDTWHRFNDIKVLFTKQKSRDYFSIPSLESNRCPRRSVFHHFVIFCVSSRRSSLSFQTSRRIDGMYCIDVKESINVRESGSK